MSDELEHVIDLERSLHRMDLRHDRELIDSILTPDFVEIGVSGRVYDRAAIIEYLLHDEDDVEIQATDFVTRRVTDDVVLVHYRSNGPSGLAQRTSLWVRYYDSWRIAFHQGTLV